jgi:hypothetical protein
MERIYPLLDFLAARRCLHVPPKPNPVPTRSCNCHSPCQGSTAQQHEVLAGLDGLRPLMGLAETAPAHVGLKITVQCLLLSPLVQLPLVSMCGSVGGSSVDMLV